MRFPLAQLVALKHELDAIGGDLHAIEVNESAHFSLWQNCNADFRKLGEKPPEYSQAPILIYGITVRIKESLSLLAPGV